MIETDGGHGRKTEPLGGLDTAVARDDRPLGIDQDRVVEPELTDTGGDLLDLPVAVATRVPTMRLQILWRAHAQPQIPKLGRNADADG
jgi:hypothetical protein